MPCADRQILRRLPGLRRLRDREVDARLWRRVVAALTHVADHADDRMERILGVAHPNAMPEWRLIREKLARQCLVDRHDPRCPQAVAIIDETALDQPDAECGQVVRGCHPVQRIVDLTG